MDAQQNTRNRCDKSHHGMIYTQIGLNFTKKRDA